MIKSFLHKGLEAFFYDGTKKGIQSKHTQKLEDILDRIHASETVEDMKYPGSNLHRLQGKKKGFWSVKVSGNWRIVFKFIDGNTHVVDYLDYH